MILIPREIQREMVNLIWRMIYLIPLMWCYATADESEVAKFKLYPSIYKVIGNPNNLRRHELIFAVKQLNIDVLKEKLLMVSNVTSPEYGHYFSRKEVASLTVNEVATDSIKAFLKAEGVSISRTTQYGEFIVASAPIYIWERMFETVFYVVAGSANIRGKSAVRALSYTIPHELRPHLLTVLNIIQTPVFETSKKTISGERISKDILIETLGTSPHDSNKAYVNDRNRAYVMGFTYPRLLNEFYNISNSEGSILTSQAVFETSGQTFSTVDMAIFESTFDLPIAQPTTDINDHIIDTACKNLKDCAEANLDLQYLMAISQNTPTT